MLRSLIPWRERLPSSISTLENEMEDLMERFLGDGENWGLVRFTPALNLSETDVAYDLSVELPGIKPEDVTVEMKEGNLWISGEKPKNRRKRASPSIGLSGVTENSAEWCGCPAA